MYHESTKFKYINPKTIKVTITINDSSKFPDNNKGRPEFTHKIFKDIKILDNGIIKETKKLYKKNKDL